MTILRIGCIVEGHGDDEAVPALVHRIAPRIVPESVVQATTILRRHRSQIVHEARLRADIDLAARRLGGPGGILIVFDADDDCPAQLGSRLQACASSARPDLPVGVVVANREFESWFLAAAESLAGFRSYSSALAAPSSPERIRGAKEWLNRHLPRDSGYTPTVDQVILTRKLDLDLARQRSDSFDKCYREIERRLTTLAGRAGTA